MTGSTERQRMNNRQIGEFADYTTVRHAARSVGRRSRSRAGMAYLSRGFVFFLAFMCILTVLMCIQYLRLKETITTQVEQNNALRAELATMRAENDATYESIQNSVDLAAIRDRAINEFGMKYATEDQVIWYNGVDEGYVEQYRDVS